MSEETSFTCTAMGVSGTTKVFVRKMGDLFVARVGIAIVGVTNMKPEELEKANPFDPDFHDNYAEGMGATTELAIEDLKQDIQTIAETLWL